MSSGADLFVICKQCGAEVSPYITECPYCGNRLRRRAPKLPRDRLRRTVRRRRGPFWPRALPNRPRLLPFHTPVLGGLFALAAVAIWIGAQGGALSVENVAIYGPLHGHWWRLFTYQFAYQGTSIATFLYGAATLATTVVFGAAVEQRHGAAVVGALFLGCGAAGALAALALYPRPLLGGSEAGAAALLGSWLVPELRAARRGRSDADLVGAATVAAVLAVLPFAVTGASWTAGLVGGACGALVGAGLNAARSRV